jgi:hypothetical protein
MFEQILIGIGAGVSVALAGFAKSEGESFDFTRFGVTALLGLAAGIVSGVVGAEVNNVYLYLVNAGGVALVENIFKAIKIRLFGK